MPGKLHNHKSLIRILWITVLLLCLPVAVYAASVMLNSGEFIGLGITSGRIVFIEKGDVDDIVIRDGQVGINVASPGQRLHLGDGNFLLEGGGETAIKIKRDFEITDGPSGTSKNPIFDMGRIIKAGDGDPELRFLYSDDNTPEQAVFEFDRKGIVASVKPATAEHNPRGSHFEGFIAGEPQPLFRLNSYPKMRLEMGNGGTTPVDVAIQRETTSTLTLLTGASDPMTERMRIDAAGNVGIGTSNPSEKLDVAGNIHASGSIETGNGYIKLGTSSGPPLKRDCNESSHVGRMKVDGSNAVLYICTALGWGELTLAVNRLNLPHIQR